jgi:hypothetical protein
VFPREYNIQRETEYTDWIIRIIASKVCYFRKEIILETMANTIDYVFRMVTDTIFKNRLYSTSDIV